MSDTTQWESDVRRSRLLPKVLSAFREIVLKLAELSGNPDGIDYTIGPMGRGGSADVAYELRVIVYRDDAMSITNFDKNRDIPPV